MKKFAAFLVLFFIFNSCASSEPPANLDDLLKEKAIAFHKADDLDGLIHEASSTKLVLLGEASHGTHEYYAWRDSISRRLISEHNFNFIVVEGDFASLYALNKYVKNLPGAASSAKEVLLNLDRWPQWMWGNYEVLALAEWLRTYNEQLPEDERVGFYGMDVYDEWRSKEALLEFLFTAHPNLFEEAKKHYECFAPFDSDSWLYARYAGAGHVNCSQNTEDVLNMLYENKHMMRGISDEDFFYALQNAYVFRNAEKFYRKSAMGLSSASWNARAIHMFETTKRLLKLYGAKSKGIVWAHNTHIGDASYTDMQRANQVNIGQLARDYFGNNEVFLVGFTTYKGYVKAGENWGSDRSKMKIPKAVNNSLEERLNRTGLASFYLIFDETDRKHNEFSQQLGNRAVGVVYNPQFDARQFVPTIVPKRYDALLFFRNTKALKPLQK